MLHTIFSCCGGLSLHNILSIAKKDLKGLFSEKTLVLTIFIQLFIALFSSFLVVGLTSFYDPGSLSESEMKSANLGLAHRSEIVLNSSTGTNGFNSSNGSNDSSYAGYARYASNIRPKRSVNETLLYRLIEVGKLSPVAYPDYSTAGRDFYRSEIDGILLVPNTTIDGSDLIDIHIYLPKTDLKATVLMLQLKEPLERFEQYARNVRTARLPGYAPIDLKFPEKPSNPYFEFIYVVLIPLLVFTPAFISGGLIIDFITEEFEQKTIDLLLVSPVTFSDILDGKILVATGIVPVQVSVWIALLSLNHIPVHNPVAILLLVTAVTLILVLTGAFIATTLKNRGTSQLFYSLILILLFLLCYIFQNSPMNLVATLAINSPGWGVYLIVYLLIAVLLYAVLHRIMRYQSRYRSGYHRRS
jgi:ABC-type transport system involved in multi-copper enzyme maturation permease subunit